MSNMYEALKNRDKFLLKFDDAPFDTNGVLKPGWAEPEFDKFVYRVADKPVLLEQSTVIPMAGLEFDLDNLEMDLELETQRDSSTGLSTGLTSVETNASRDRKVLIARPLQAKSVIPDNWLDENIEKENYLDLHLSMIADELGPAFEKWGIYADTSVSTVSGEGTGYKMTDGILTQLKAISADSNLDEHGLAKLVYQDNIGNGIVDAILRYIEQDGDISGARCVLPPTIYARLMAEIAQDRNTNLGDAVLQTADMTKILGVEIVQDNVLNKKYVRNGYGTMKFTNGEYKANGSNTTDMVYGFITKPENLVWGLSKHNFEIKHQWDIDALGTKIAALCKGDVKVRWAYDTLAIPFTMNNTPS